MVQGSDTNGPNGPSSGELQARVNLFLYQSPTPTPACSSPACPLPHGSVVCGPEGFPAHRVCQALLRPGDLPQCPPPADLLPAQLPEWACSTTSPTVSLLLKHITALSDALQEVVMWVFGKSVGHPGGHRAPLPLSKQGPSCGCHDV